MTIVAGFEITKRIAPEVEVPQTLCLFRRVTDLPCPTCGATRVVLAAGRGEPGRAFAQNPLLVIVGVIGLAWLILRLGFGRTVDLGLSSRERRVMWPVIAVLFIANWAYVIWRHRSGS